MFRHFKANRLLNIPVLKKSEQPNKDVQGWSAHEKERVSYNFTSIDIVLILILDKKENFFNLVLVFSVLMILLPFILKAFCQCKENFDLKKLSMQKKFLYSIFSLTLSSIVMRYFKYLKFTYPIIICLR